MQLRKRGGHCAAKHVRMIALVVAALIVLPLPAFAASPWENAVQVLQTAFTGTIARGLSLVAIVVGGLMFAFGEGESKRLLAGIVLISNSDPVHETDEQLLQRLYGLTPADSKVATRLEQGQDASICDEMNNAANTARTHIKRLLRMKTPNDEQRAIGRFVHSDAAVIDDLDLGADPHMLHKILKRGSLRAPLRRIRAVWL